MRGFVLLCLAVLAAIGIGVGIEAAAGSSGPAQLGTYGPPAHRFVAAFPVTPRSFAVHVDGIEGGVVAARAAGTSYEVEYLQAGPGAPAAVRRALPAAAAILATPRSRVLANLERALSARLCHELGGCGVWTGYAPLQGGRSPLSLRIAGRPAHTLFIRATSKGRRVTVGVAKAVVGNTLWSVSAIGDPARVEAFVRSFQPLG